MLRQILRGRRLGQDEEGGAGGEEGKERKGSIKKDPAVWFLPLRVPLCLPEAGKWSPKSVCNPEVAGFCSHLHDNSPKWNCPAVLFTQLMALPLILGNFSLRSLRKLVHFASLQVSSFKMGLSLCWLSAFNVMNGLLVSVYMSGRSRSPNEATDPPGGNGI